MALSQLTISNRGREVQGSPIRKLAAIAEKRKREGIRVYHLNIGQPDLPSPEVVQQFFKTFSRRTIEYAPSNGLPETISAWRKYFENYDIYFDDEEIIVTTGGSEAIAFAISAICDPGDEVIVFEPFYTNYNGFASLAGVKLVPVELNISNSFSLPPKEVIEKYITIRTKAILFCDPSNPTGRIFTEDEIRNITDIARTYNLFLIADEVYREFAYDRKPISIARIPELSDRVIIVDSCSKRFNMCGARIGALASKNKDIIDAVLKFSMARLSVATIDQLSVIPLLENSALYTQPIVEEFHKRRDIVYEALSTIPEITYYKPEGAFYIIIGLPVKDSEHFAKWLIEEFHENKETVLLAPAQGFYATPGKGINEVRLAFMLNVVDLKRSIELIGRAIQQYKTLFAE
ncbi:MAG: pyridoxal phosphate-dependent aminotransferase [Bacteroidetes bacterium]|nr:pyridoxal phosphate-dependent aminotransferase [Bacteroidota bacterium]